MLVFQFRQLLQLRHISAALVLITLSFSLWAVDGEVRKNEPVFWVPDTIHFEFGYDRDNVNFRDEYPSSSYIKNLISEWDWGNGPKSISAEEACVFKDVSNNCNVPLYQGGIKRNNRNQIHFKYWPSDFEEWLAVTKEHRTGGITNTNEGIVDVYDDADILMNHNIHWITRDLISTCNRPDAFLFETTLLHEIGHALGLPDTYTDFTRMRDTGSACGKNFQIKSVFVTAIDKQNLSNLYGPIKTVDVNIGFPYDNAVLFAGQFQTFNASTNSINTTSSVEQNKNSGNKPSATSSIVWASDLDGELGTGDFITVDDLSVGHHLITATVGSEGSNTYGEDFVAIEVIGQSSTDYDNYLFPVPCTKLVDSPWLGCLMKFRQNVLHPGCFLPKATIHIQNMNTGSVIASTYLPSQSCYPDDLLEYEYEFRVSDPSDLADVKVYFELNDSGCGIFGAPCFTHTVRATVPIVQTSIDITEIPENCIIQAGEQYCDSQISWENHYFAPYSALFYKPIGGNNWVKIGNVGTSSGSHSIPGLDGLGDIEVAIFQYGTEGFGSSNTPTGMLAGPYLVGGRFEVSDEFMGETVLSWLSAQDKDFDSWNVLDGGTTLNLFGNTWKAIDYNYNVTADTWLEVDYKSDGQDAPEIGGITLLSSLGYSSGTTFQIHGTQTYGNQWFNRYFDDGWKTFRMNVGHVMKNMSWSKRNVKYLGFIGDIDASNKQINISYRNPRLFQKATTHLPQWGHSGNWFDPETSGQGFALEVNPINEMVVAQWFTYASDGHGKGASSNRWYMQSGSYDADSSSQDSLSLDIYQVTGGRFNRTNVVTQKVIGTAKFRFFDCNTAHIEYDFYTGYNAGRHGYIPLTRLTPNIDCSEGEYNGPHKSDFGYTGNWYNPPTSGQGFAFELNPQAGVLIAQWFTYLPGYSSNLNNPNRQRWFTLVGDYTPGNPNSNSLTIYQSKKGALDDPYPVTTTPVGTANVVFTSCTTARINYAFSSNVSDFANLSGTIDLVRITSNVTCE